MTKREESLITVKDSDFFFTQEENTQKGFPNGTNDYEFRIKVVDFEQVLFSSSPTVFKERKKERKNENHSK